MKRIIILAAMLSLLLFSIGTVQAATSGLDNMPGGAGVIYWQVGSNWTTLWNIQNIENGFNLTVHVAVYNSNSNEMCDFSFPMTSMDNVGFSVNATSDPTHILIVPYSDEAFGGSGIPAAGVLCPNAVTTGGIANGYITYVLDNITAAGVDPTTFTFSHIDFVNPDWLIQRAAYIRGTDAAFAYNGASLQGFANMMQFNGGLVGLNEATFGGDSQFVNTWGVDALCTVAVNWDGTAATAFGTIDDTAGPNIDPWELYLTDNVNTSGAAVFRTRLLADGAFGGGAACTPAGRKRALGSASGFYWGRYNQLPGLTTSVLVLVFPANSGAGVADPRGCVSIVSFDDMEHSQSVSPCPPEVTRLLYITPGGVTGDIPNLTGRGESRIFTQAPLAGFIYTESAGFADIFALVQEEKWAVTTNLTDGLGFFFPDPVVTTTNAILLD